MPWGVRTVRLPPVTRTSSTLPGAPPARPSLLLLPKIVFVAVLFGSFVSVLVLILATPLESRADWQGLVDAVGTIFKIVIVPGSFVVVVFSVLLLIKHRRWFLKQRWAQVKVLLLVAALPASHLAARSVFSGSSSTR